MKKLLSLLLAFVLVLSLASCGDDVTTDETGNATTDSQSTGTEDSSSETTNDAEDTEEEPEEVELTLWIPSRGLDEFTMKRHDIFMENNPHVTLNEIIHEGDAGNDFFQGVAAGNAPDLVEVSFTMMDKYIAAGILEPLNGYMDEWEETSDIPEKYIDMVSDNDDNVYGVIKQVAPMLFGYNAQIFEDAGLEVPQTWDEMMEAAIALTDPSIGQIGYGMLAKEWTEWWFQYYVWQAGGDLTNRLDNGNVELTFTDPAVIEAAEFYQELRAAGVTQTDITMNFEDLVKAFSAGQIAMMPFAPDWVNWAAGLGMDPEHIGLSLYPEGPAGNRSAAISGTYYVINPQADQATKDAAWEYIKYMAGKEFFVSKFEDQAANGSVDPLPIPRISLTMTDIVPDYDPELEELLSSAALIGLPEFYAKATVGSYIDMAVQRIIADPNADPLTEFQRVQDQCEDEVLPDFNVN